MILDSISERLAQYYLDYDISKLPENVLERTKEIVLDYLGCAIGGANLDTTIKVKNVFIQNGSAGDSTVILGQKAACEKAAFINGVASHSLEVDDTSPTLAGHPSVVVVSAALAVAEKLNASGFDFLTSVIFGYDLMKRVSQAVNMDSHFERGFHPTSTVGIFAATLSASLLLKLNKTQIANALGIAGGFASGNLECYQDGSLTKRLNPGNAAQGAVIAAMLAAQDYTGPRWIFEGKSGFLHGYTDGAKPELMLENLDYSDYPVMITAFKPYSCCKYNHSPIDAVISIIKANHIDFHDIDEITIDVSSMALRAIAEPKDIKYNPPNVASAQFSLPFSASVAAIRGRAFIEEYTEEMLHNQDVVDMMKKVKIIHTSQMDIYLPKDLAAEAKIRLKNGKEFSKRVIYSKGDRENPLSKEELEDKFRTLAKLSLDSNEKMDSIIKTVYSLDKLNISDLCNLL